MADVTLTGAVLELAVDRDVDAAVGESCSLQIDSIADDEVGVTMRAIVTGVERHHDEAAGDDGDGGRVLVAVEFDARREESLLLHLLVRLHAVV